MLSKTLLSALCMATVAEHSLSLSLPTQSRSEEMRRSASTFNRSFTVSVPEDLLALDKTYCVTLLPNTPTVQGVLQLTSIPTNRYNISSHLYDAYPNAKPVYNGLKISPHMSLFSPNDDVDITKLVKDGLNELSVAGQRSAFDVRTEIWYNNSLMPMVTECGLLPLKSTKDKMLSLRMSIQTPMFIAFATAVFEMFTVATVNKEHSEIEPFDSHLRVPFFSAFVHDNGKINSTILHEEVLHYKTDTVSLFLEPTAYEMGINERNVFLDYFLRPGASFQFEFGFFGLNPSTEASLTESNVCRSISQDKKGQKLNVTPKSTIIGTPNQRFTFPYHKWFPMVTLYVDHFYDFRITSERLFVSGWKHRLMANEVPTITCIHIPLNNDSPDSLHHFSSIFFGAVSMSYAPWVVMVSVAMVVMMAMVVPLASGMVMAGYLFKNKTSVQVAMSSYKARVLHLFEQRLNELVKEDQRQGEEQT